MNVRAFFCLAACLPAIASVMAPVVHADTMPADPNGDTGNLLPDFYSDPAISTSSGYLGGDGLVSVDPFTGMALVTNTDIVIPGNGGLDIVIQRTYRSPDPWAEPEHSTVGLGWSLHYGYVDIADPAKMCDTSYNAHTADNPVYVAPDGSSHVLALAYATPVDAERPTYVASDYSVMFCQTDGTFYMMSTNGTRYDFGQQHIARRGATRWVVTKVTDRNGNYLDISYTDSGSYGSQGKVIAAILANDGRQVTFTYSGLSSQDVTLSTITTPVGIWTFDYQPAAIANYPGLAQLVGVEDPVGLEWTYEYWPYQSDGSSGSTALKKVTNPHGASETLTYAKVRFSNRAESRESSVVVSHLKEAGPGTTGTWTYSYSASSTDDTTVVTGPDGIRTFYHFGYQEAVNSAVDDAWRIGTLKQVVYEPSEGPVRTETYTWEPNLLSQENYFRTREDGLDNYGPWDNEYNVPRLKQKVVNIDGATFTTDYVQFLAEDAAIPPLPVLIQESTSSPQFSSTRQISNTYWVSPSKWIYALPDSISYDGDQGTLIDHEYDENGNITRLYDKGVYTWYTYDSQGNVASEKKGDYQPIQYSDYLAGVPRRVDFPDGGYLDRDVNSLGLITRESNALGEETEYVYDSIGRLEQLQPPLGSTTFLTWTPNSVTLQRGSYTKLEQWDGLGRVLLARHSGEPGMTIEIGKEYDHAGRITETEIQHVESALTYTATYDWDEYGRILALNHPGGSRQYSYTGTSRTMADERGYLTTTHYQAYGGLSYEDSTYIDQQGADPITIVRNSKGQPLSVEQGGIVKEFAYHDSHQLRFISDPEAGVRYYGWDTAGNLTSLHFAASQSSPIYSLFVNEWDDLGRMTKRTDAVTAHESDPVTGTQTFRTREEVFTYDLAGRLQTSTRTETTTIHLSGDTEPTFVLEAPVSWEYDYDAGGALTSAILQVGSKEFTVGYTYDSDRNVSSMTYPSGETVDYAPGAYGWPSKLGRFASAIDYHLTGMPASITYANGDTITLGMNPRLLVESLSVNAGNTLSHTYEYDGSGNILVIDDLLDTSASRAFSYDAAGRLIGAQGPWGVESYSFDGTGNVMSSDRNGQSLVFQYDSANRLSSVTGRFGRTYTYNDRGAATQSGDWHFARDGDDRIWRAWRGDEASIDFDYDANGWRVKASQGEDREQYFVYDRSGKLIYQLDTQHDWYKEYYRAGSRTIATRRIDIECTDDFDQDGVPHCVERGWQADPYDPSDAANDADDDGLDNYQEYLAGTNATRADTDGDGMPDGYEVASDLDPLADDAAQDADADGVSNHDEYERGTDPNIPDPPSAVAELNAVAGDQAVMLSWPASSLAAEYRLYYAAQPITSTAGLPYFDVTGEQYIDVSVTNGVKRYYVLTAVNQIGESAASPMAAAMPSEPAWWHAVGAEGTDMAQNAYILDESYGPSLTIYASDGSEPVVTSFLPTDIRIEAAKVGLNGHVVVVWQEDTTDGRYTLNVSAYDPRAGWERDTIFTGATAGDVAVDVNARGDIVIAYFKATYVTRPDGHTQAQPVPYALIREAGVRHSWPSAARLDDGQWTSEGIPELRVELSPDGKSAIAGWSGAYWNGSESDPAAWVNVYQAGAWAGPHLLAGAQGACCDDPLWLDALPEIGISDGGVAFASLDTAEVHFLYDGAAWSSAQAGAVRVGFAQDGSLVRLRADENGLAAETGALVGGQFVWSNPDTLAAAGTEAIAAVGATSVSPHRLLWRDASGIVRQSSLSGSVWVEDNLSTPNFDDLRYVERDEVGNLYVTTAERAYVLSPRQGNFRPALTASVSPLSGDELQDITLSATASDIDGDVSYEWVQLSGLAVTIADPLSANTTATLPDIPGTTDSITLAVRVTDSGGMMVEEVFTVTVTGSGPAPAVDLGSDLTVDEGSLVTIQATVSDGDDNIDTSFWNLIRGPLVESELFDPWGMSFVAPDVYGDVEITIELWVSDAEGQSAWDTITVTVQDTDAPLPPGTPPPTPQLMAQPVDVNGQEHYGVMVMTDRPARVYFRVLGDHQLIGGASESASEPGWYESASSSPALIMKLADTITIEYWAEDSAGASAVQSSGPL